MVFWRLKSEPLFGVVKFRGSRLQSPAPTFFRFDRPFLLFSSGPSEVSSMAQGFPSEGDFDGPL